MRFRRDSDLESCGVSIIKDSGANVREAACMRIEGHKGEHIATMGPAAKEDGVCHSCREEIPNHEDGCIVLEAKDEV